jgi:hypothetical protein
MDWLESTAATDGEEGDESAAAPGEADITESSLRRWSIAPLPEQATLRQALDRLRSKTVEAVCVYTRDSTGKRTLRGVVTRDGIEKFTLSQIDI